MTTVSGIHRLLLDRLASGALDAGRGIIAAHGYDYRRPPC